jgi:hypothetical protein
MGAMGGGAHAAPIKHTKHWHGPEFNAKRNTLLLVLVIWFREIKVNTMF